MKRFVCHQSVGFDLTGNEILHKCTRKLSDIIGQESLRTRENSVSSNWTRFPSHSSVALITETWLMKLPKWMSRLQRLEWTWGSRMYITYQWSHATIIVKEACKLLTCFVCRDMKILRFRSHISEGAYSDRTSIMSENEILSGLTQELTRIYPFRSRCIAKNIHSSKCLGPEHGYHRWLINYAFSKPSCLPSFFTGETVNNIFSKNPCVFLCSFLIAPESTHAIPVIDSAQIDTPKLAFCFKRNHSNIVIKYFRC